MEHLKRLSFLLFMQQAYFMTLLIYEYSCSYDIHLFYNFVLDSKQANIQFNLKFCGDLSKIMQ